MKRLLWRIETWWVTTKKRLRFARAMYRNYEKFGKRIPIASEYVGSDSPTAIDEFVGARFKVTYFDWEHEIEVKQAMRVWGL